MDYYVLIMKDDDDVLRLTSFHSAGEALDAALKVLHMFMRTPEIHIVPAFTETRVKA